MSDSSTTQFAGQTALVTGASRGIGRAIALELAQHGARLACVATRAENAAGTVAAIVDAGGSARAYGCRVERGDEVRALFEAVAAELGPVDVLVNNAGVSKPMATLDMTEASWDEHMDVNAKSIFLCAQAAARQMQATGGGVIVNIGSILGRNAFPATLGYCTSKAAVDHMTRVLAIEWARYGIRVNCIAPGYVDTDMIEGLEQDGKLAAADLVRRTPQRRLGTADEIAHAVRFVASRDAAFMTGETLVIDGGWTAFGFYQRRGS
ncbi:MAG: glucose 1-dehydrogenase [Gammaproteobacteria bacterium]|nr:glucose 1-dehydrogenase [Gammaproteobacteria bacterium]